MRQQGLERVSFTEPSESLGLLSAPFSIYQALTFSKKLTATLIE